ncbi:MAG: slipin family protein [Candidatus Hydrogenedentes bacterium]|nr:slipin family protein [Candidatus Hydrogenedentota bacterium]
MQSGTPRKHFAEPARGHVSLGLSLRALILFVLLGPPVVYFVVTPAVQTPPNIVILIVVAIVLRILISGIRVAAQWERAIVLRLGEFHAVRGPGIFYIIPIIEWVRFIDTRTLVLNVPKQKVITKDNVPAEIDGALFFLVSDPERAIVKVQDYQFAMAQYAQAALRDVVGGLSLDELLTERERIQQHIAEIVQEHVSNWGLHVDSIRLLDIELPEDLKRMMSRQASAEREKRATITKAEGDKLAALNLAQAAETMRSSPGAMQLRTLQTIDGLGPTASNTVVLYPIELTEAFKTLSAIVGRKAPSEDKGEGINLG